MSVSPELRSPPDAPEDVTSQDAEGDVNNQDQVPPPKRKGGRKPIYATSEERKQRNRQAQAAFRERRTEYIKQLEVAIKENEKAFEVLEQNHRHTSDECDVLKHKNMLLERIIVEKGYDVQAELRARGESPVPRLQHASPASPGASIAHQAIMNRHQQAIRQPARPSIHQESRFNGLPLQPLGVSPATPQSSQYSSPAMTFNSPIMDSNGSLSSVPQPFQQQHQSAPPQFNYSEFSSGPHSQVILQRSDFPAAQNDPKYGSDGIGGYHTPTSMDDHSSRHSSLAQTVMTSLGKLSPLYFSSPYERAMFVLD